jgi:hypothetical protein
MGEARRRRGTRAEALGAAIKQMFGGGKALELAIFTIEALFEFPETVAERPMALWRIETATEVARRRNRSELACLCCETPIILEMPSAIGFLRGSEGSEREPLLVRGLRCLLRRGGVSRRSQRDGDRGD